MINAKAKKSPYDRSFVIRGDALELLFFLIPVFRPECISTLMSGSVVDYFFIAWRFAAYFYILLKCIYSNKRILSIQFFIAVAFEAVLMYSAYINHVSLSGRLSNFANFVGILLLFNFYSQANPRRFIEVLYKYLTFLITINLILSLVFPTGFNHALSDSARVNFLGKDNAIGFTLIFTTVISVMYKNIRPDTNSPLFTFFIVIVTEIFYRSGSGIVAIAFLAVYLIFIEKIKLVNMLAKAWLLFGIIIVLEFLMVFAQDIDLFSGITSLLGKSNTFSTRLYYWQVAIEQISASPVFGQGSDVVHLWNEYYSHNAVLDVLLKGGMVGLAVWITLIGSSIYKVSKIKTEKIRVFFYVAFFAFFLVGLMEGLEDRIAFMAMIALSININHFEKQGLLSNELLLPKIKISRN